MVEVYRTEEEQAEALKRWWDKNGRNVLVAVVVFIALAFGWKSWQQQQRNQAEMASLSYEMLMTELEQQPQQAMERGRQILADYPDSNYAALAAMAMARASLEQGKGEEAAVHLRWTMDNAALEELRPLARLRLARIQLELGKPDEAMATLDGGANNGYGAGFYELRGDILLAQGKRSEARAAYLRAQVGYADVSGKHALLSMKIDDLADAAEVAGQ